MNAFALRDPLHFHVDVHGTMCIKHLAKLESLWTLTFSKYPRPPPAVDIGLFYSISPHKEYRGRHRGFWRLEVVEKKVRQKWWGCHVTRWTSLRRAAKPSLEGVTGHLAESPETRPISFTYYCTRKPSRGKIYKMMFLPSSL